MDLDKEKQIIDTIRRCQRNWDHSKCIPEEHIDHWIYIATNAPSKQDESYFNLYVITDKEKIELLSNHTWGHTMEIAPGNLTGVTRNTQMFANAYFVFTFKLPRTIREISPDGQQFDQTGLDAEVRKRNGYVAIGIAAGLIAQSAADLGYKTGFNSNHCSHQKGGPNQAAVWYKTLGIDPSALSEKDINNTGKGNNKRQLSFEGPEDVGKIIADITINNNGDEIYLSIKDPKGTGIYNGGNVKFIKQNKEDNTVYFDEDAFINDTSVTKEIFSSIGIDPQKIVNGLNDYINKEGLPSQREQITDYDDTQLHNLLASSYGYGYWYVRQTKPGELKIVNIESPEDAYEIVGDIQSVEIKYPSINSKSTEIKIKTSSQLMGDNIYQIDIRNSSGGIIPGLKVKTLK
jgi:hypothetical protein